MYQIFSYKTQKFLPGLSFKTRGEAYRYLVQHSRFNTSGPYMIVKIGG